MRSARFTVARRWAMTSVVRPARQPLQRLLHRALALGVERAGRLVEQQDRRVAQDRAGDREALALAAGEHHAALADLGVVALRQPGDELVRRGGAGRRLDLGVAGLRPAEADVLARRGGEDHRLLRHQRDCAAQVGARQLAQVDAVERRRGRRPGRRSAAAAGRSWSCRRRTGRPAPRSRPGAMRRLRSSSAGVVRPRRIVEGDALEGDRAPASAPAAAPGLRRVARSGRRRGAARPCARWRRPRAAARPRSRRAPPTDAGDHHRVDHELDQLARASSRRRARRARRSRARRRSRRRRGRSRSRSAAPRVRMRGSAGVEGALGQARRSRRGSRPRGCRPAPSARRAGSRRPARWSRRSGPGSRATARAAGGRA